MVDGRDYETRRHSGVAQRSVVLQQTLNTLKLLGELAHVAFVNRRSFSDAWH
jgi:hypothetical protein